MIRMCWSTPGKNCAACQKIFDACKHETTFANNRGYIQCVFCDTELRKVPEAKKIKDVCPYCNHEYTTKRECSQMCMAR